MRTLVIAFSVSAVACVSAHPAEYASKHWGCPEARIKVADARAQAGGHAYAVTGCGKKMTVECVYNDVNPDTPYECTSRDEGDVAAAAPAVSKPAPSTSTATATASAAPPPSPAPPSAPATMIAPASSTTDGARYVATDGRSFPFSERDSKTAAIAASGAFDLACAPAGVTARVLYTADLGKPLYVAEGCGQRATYALVRRGAAEPEVDVVFLTGVVPVKSASPSP